MMNVKPLLDSFDLSIFGTATPDICAIAEKQYSKPTQTVKTCHPRICLTEDMLPGIRAALAAPQNKAIADQFRAYADADCDGVLGAPEEKFLNRAGLHNFDHRVLATIEAKALNFLLTRDARYGYQALYAMLNFLRTLDIQWIACDGCREHGYGMFVAAEVYDWCYGLMTPELRQAMIAAVESRLCAGEQGDPSFTPVGIYKRKMEVGFPPTTQDSGVNGHGSEAQILRDYLSFALAIHDENPSWWEMIGGCLQDNYIPVRQEFYKSDFYPQGIGYLCHRFFSDLYSAWLYMHATGENPYTGVERIVPSLFALELPNGKNAFAAGDGGPMASLTSFKNLSILTGAISGDPLVWSAARAVGAFDGTGTGTTTITASAFLILAAGGTPFTEADYHKQLPLHLYNGGFLGQMTTRARWNDESAPAVQMKVGVKSTANHDHGDSGAFQIYYKGLLTHDGGLYVNFGHYQTRFYHGSSVSHNTLLFVDPAKADAQSEDLAAKWYSGSQRIRMSVADWLKSDACVIGEVTGHSCGYKNSQNSEGEYAYIAGNIAKAYTDEAEYAERAMLTVYTGDADFPMVLFIRDDMTVSKPEIKKTFLLQIPSPDAPVLSGNTVMTEKDGGRLVLTSLSENACIEGVGGEGKHHFINGMECLALGNHQIVNGRESKAVCDRNDGHWGRVEITLPTDAKDGVFLNVLHVTDAGSDKTAPAIAKIPASGAAGACFGNIAALFASSREKAPESVSFTLASESKVYLTGIAAGEWNVTANGQTVGTYTATEEGAMIAFTAPAGEITVMHA